MVSTIHAALHQPFRPEWIEKWDGAFSSEQRESCLWLFEAIASGQPNLVRAMLRLGARTNTLVRENALHPLLYSTTPLSMALWLDTHDRQDKSLPPIEAKNGALRPVSGVVPVLLDGGAAPLFRLGSTLDDPSWEDVQHPLFVQLEAAQLDRIARGDGLGVTTQADCQRDDARGWHYYRTSVVAEHPGHNAHLWLHRAIQLQRWDVLNVWWAQGGAVGVEGGDSALAMLWQQRFRTPVPVDRPTGRRSSRARTSGRLAPMPTSPTLPALDPIPDKVLNRELAQLRPALLQAGEVVYRQEVIALLALVLGPGGPTDTAVGQDALAWVDALLKTRPLISFAVSDADWEDRRRLSPLAHAPVRQHLLTVEQGHLRTVVPRTGRSGMANEPLHPERRRL